MRGLESDLCGVLDLDGRLLLPLPAGGPAKPMGGAGTAVLAGARCANPCCGITKELMDLASETLAGLLGGDVLVETRFMLVSSAWKVSWSAWVRDATIVLK